MIFKSKFLAGIFLAQALPFATVAAFAEPVEIPAPVDKIFVPTGFDDNDNSEVVVHGHFRNSCFRVGKISSTVDAERSVINVTATSLEYRGTTCLQVIVPFIQELKIGVLKAGNYTLVVNEDTSKSIKFEVKPSMTDSADDFYYAPVNSAELVRASGTNNELIKIRGNYPLLLHGCAIIEEVKVIRNETNNVIAVLPIMQFFDGKPCVGHKLKYETYVDLDTPFEGEGLLHVRSMNGNSFNQFIEVE
jgi:hypothetical protein